MRALLKLLLAVAALVTVLLALLVVGSRTPWVEDRVRALLVAVIRDAIAGDVRIGRVHGTLGRTLVIDDLRVRVAGRTVVHVPRVAVRYAVLPLLRGEVRVRRLTVEAPRVMLVRDAAGWRVPGLRPREEDAGDTRSLTVALRRIEVRAGRVGVALLDAAPPRRLAVTAIALDGSARIAGPRLEAALARLDAVPRGVALGPLAGRGRVVADAGRAEVHDFRLATPRTVLTADGRVERDVRVAATVSLDPLAHADVRAVVPDVALVTDVRAVARADGPWRDVVASLDTALGAAGEVDGAARVDLGATPPRHRTRVRLRAVDPAALVAGLPAARLNGRLYVEGRGLDPNAPLAYDLDLADSRVESQPIDALGVRGRAVDGAHRARIRLDVPAGTVAARARVTLAQPIAYSVDGRAALTHVERLVASVPGRLRARFRADGRDTAAATRQARARVTIEGGTLRGVAIEGGEASARLEGERIEDVRATLAVAGARLEATGRGGLAPPAVDARLTAAGDLAGVGAALGTTLAGTARAEATAHGPLDALAVQARLDADALAAPGVRAARATLTADGAGIGGPNGRATSRLALLEADVGLPGRHAVEATLAWQRASGTDRATLEASARPAGEGARAEAALAASRAADGAVTGSLHTLELALPDLEPWRLERPASFALEDGVRVDALAIGIGPGRVVARGHVAAAGANEASVTLDALPLRPLCLLATGAECTGSTSGTVTLGGTAHAPRAGAAVTADAVSVDGVAYGTVRLEAGYVDRAVSVRALLAHPQAGTLELTGAVPADLAWAGERRDLSEAPVDLALRASRLDLTFVRTLAPGTIRRTAGRASIDLRLTGPRTGVRVDGQVALDEGRLELAATGVAWQDIRVRLDAAGRRMVVRELSARGGDGRLAAEGSIGVEDLTAPALDLEVQVDEFFAFRREIGEAAASGSVRVGGTLPAPVVTGDIQVVRAVLRPAALPATKVTLEPDPTIVVVRHEGEVPPVAPPPAEKAPAPVENLRLDVRVEIARNAWIRRADANIELGGTVRVTKEPGAAIALVGEITLLRGWYAFQGRRFEIEEGRIRFTGQSPPDPYFDVRAVYATPGYRVTVRVEGSGAKPQLLLSSEPPLEQADILAVLLFGKPTNELGQGESSELQRTALGLASGYVMPELRSSIMSTLGLDTFDVALPAGTEEPGSVRVGRYVTSDVFVALAYEFGARSGEVVSVEYGLTRSLVVRGSTSTRGASALDVYWRRRY